MHTRGCNIIGRHDRFSEWHSLFSGHDQVSGRMASLVEIMASLELGMASVVGGMAIVVGTIASQREVY